MTGAGEFLVEHDAVRFRAFRCVINVPRMSYTEYITRKLWRMPDCVSYCR